MPLFIGRSQAQIKIIESLPSVLNEIKTIYDLSDGDMPNTNVLASKLRASDFRLFPTLNRKVISELDELIQIDIPNLMRGVGGVSEYELQEVESARKTNNSTSKRLIEITLKDKLVSKDYNECVYENKTTLMKKIYS